MDAGELDRPRVACPRCLLEGEYECRSTGGLDSGLGATLTRDIGSVKKLAGRGQELEVGMNSGHNRCGWLQVFLRH